MRLKDLMTRHVETVDPEATLQEAAQRMRDHDVGSIPVARDGKAIDILTDRDIAIRATAGPWNAR